MIIIKILSKAYLGDAVYELFIREHLVNNISSLKLIQEESLKYVSATSQRKHLEILINKDFLTVDELDIIRKGRNAKGGKSKSTDIKTYRLATGLECLFGQLYIDENILRIKEIIKEIVGE